SMKIPQTMTIGGRDLVDLYLVAMNSHDGTSAFRLLVSPVRVVCANTLADAVWTSTTDTPRAKTLRNNRDHELRRLMWTGETNANIRGTRWAAYQAVTEYLDHTAPIAAQHDKAGARAE